MEEYHESIRSVVAEHDVEGLFELIAFGEENALLPIGNFLSDLLLLSVEHNDYDAVRILLLLPIDIGVDAATDDNKALITACTKGFTDIVQFLLQLPLERGVNPSVHSNLPLQEACGEGFYDIAKILIDLPLERGVYPGDSDNICLFNAGMGNYKNIVELLLSLPAERGVDAYLIFPDMVLFKNFDIADMLLNAPKGRKADPGAEDNKLLLEVCEIGDIDQVRYLLSRGADPSARRNLPLITAIMFDKTDIVELLLSLPILSGVNPSVGGGMPLILACEGGNADIVKLLLDLPTNRGVIPSVHGNLAFKRAIGSGNLDVVKVLLDLPPDRLRLYANDNDLFRFACEIRNIKVAKLLTDLPLDRGINPAAVNNQALRIACEKSHVDVATFLLELDPNRGIDASVNHYESFFDMLPEFEVNKVFFLLFLYHPSFDLANLPENVNDVVMYMLDYWQSKTVSPYTKQQDYSQGR